MYKKITVVALTTAMLLSPVPAYAFFDVLLHLTPLAVIPFVGKDKQTIHWCPNDVRVYKTKQTNVGYFVGIDGKKKLCRLK